MATQSKPRLRQLPDTIRGLRVYEVSLDGTVLGTVAQERSSTTHGYSGSRLGYNTYRTTWCWETEDNCGDYELRTRTEAVEGLVDFQSSRYDRKT